MRIIICGHSRHGKDTLAEILKLQFGLKFQTSSFTARDEVFTNCKLLQSKYKNPIDAWENRHAHRQEWFDGISRICGHDDTALANKIFSDAEVYCGMRRIEELRACQQRWPEVVAMWVDASDRLPLESDKSNTITKDHCEFTIHNNGTEQEFERKVYRHFIRYEGL